MGRNGVHPDVRLGSHGTPRMKAHLFSWWDQAPSPPPPAGPAHPLGWMCSAEVRERHSGTIPPRKGMVLTLETAWAQVKRSSVPIATTVWEVWGHRWAPREPGRGKSLLEPRVW